MPRLTEINAADHPEFDNHERVVRIEDEASGLQAIVAVHNTTLGPSLGGCRYYAYQNENQALNDVLRLSRGMTYKSALAGLPIGGGKSVIVANPDKPKTPEMMRAFGRGLEKLGGIYITAEDVGTTEADMETIAMETSFVSGLPPSEKNPLSGNPSPLTALGVFCSLREIVKATGRDSLNGLHCGILGLGAVGYALAKYLDEAGARLTVADINSASLERARAEFKNVQIVSPQELPFCEMDVYAPCALGGGLNDETISRLQAWLVCGAANNQLAKSNHGKMLHDKNILYAPDYVVNAGGIIAVAYAHFHEQGKNPFGHALDHEHMVKHVESIGQTAKEIYMRSRSQNEPTNNIADQMAEKIFKK